MSHTSHASYSSHSSHSPHLDAWQWAGVPRPRDYSTSYMRRMSSSDLSFGSTPGSIWFIT
jgi:hypothetical protein